eukprot:scaffold252_cov338-Pavlova_lutheri.AAC.3
MELLGAVRKVAARVRSLGGVKRAGVLTGLADGNYGCVKRKGSERTWSKPRGKRRNAHVVRPDRTLRWPSYNPRSSREKSLID